MEQTPYIITVASEKGGVGKTTLACNLAVYIKATCEDLPVTILSLDNHRTVDRMFALGSDGSTVGDFLACRALSPALGQYGVQYLASADNNDAAANRYVKPTSMLEAVAASGLTGVVIIDTRPILDNLTASAIIAADRALVPVRDSASLENCRNIFALFEQKGMDKSSLLLVPSIVDARVKFSGTFANMDQLIRGFALHRGYRIAATSIPKSPKVEALATNPRGSVLSVLHHARGTEAHQAFRELARQLAGEAKSTAATRTRQFVDWQSGEEAKRKARADARRAQLDQCCPACGAPARPAAWAAVSGDSVVAMLHDDCLEKLLIPAIYGTAWRDDTTDGSLTYRTIREACRRATHYAAPRASGGCVASVEIVSDDTESTFASTIDLTRLPDHADDSARKPLHALLSLMVAGYGGRRSDRSVSLVRLPLAVDVDDRTWSGIVNRAAAIKQLADGALAERG